MKIAVVGSRNFKDMDLVSYVVCKTFLEASCFISGGARGVDTIAEEAVNNLLQRIHEYHKTKKIEKKIFYADWNDLSHTDAVIKTNSQGKKYDAKAGYRRNKLIVKEADKIIAFWDGKSKGTKHTIDLAINANKPVDIYIRT